MAFQESDICGVLKDMSDDELAQLARARDEAEAAGVFDERPDDDIVELNVDQEIALHFAASSLSQLAKETGCPVSELLKIGGVDNG